MSGNESKRKMVRPWRILHVVIWLIGIYILVVRNWWWPGILVLVDISALYEGFLQRFVPQAYVEENPIQAVPMEPTVNAPISSPGPITAATAIMPRHRIELLPQVCPACNRPIRGHEVKWTGPQSANCPYCGTNLPMKKD